MAKNQPVRVHMRRCGSVEVGRLTRRGRPSYVWVQGWSYTLPSGQTSNPAKLDEARHMARGDYPGCAIILC